MAEGTQYLPNVAMVEVKVEGGENLLQMAGTNKGDGDEISTRSQKFGDRGELGDAEVAGTNAADTLVVPGRS